MVLASTGEYNIWIYHKVLGKYSVIPVCVSKCGTYEYNIFIYHMILGKYSLVRVFV